MDDQILSRHILAVAGRLFRADGYAAVSVARICMEAGITSFSFEQAFHDKRAMTCVLIREQFLVLEESLHVGRNHHPDQGVLAHMVFAANCPPHGAATPLGVIVALSAIDDGVPEEVREEIKKGLHAWGKKLAVILSLFNTRSADEQEQLAERIICVLLGTAVYCKIEPETINRMRLEELLSTLMRQ